MEDLRFQAPFQPVGAGKEPKFMAEPRPRWKRKRDREPPGPAKPGAGGVKEGDRPRVLVNVKSLRPRQEGAPAGLRESMLPDDV